MIVFSEKTASSAPIFDNLCILKLNDIITYQITSFVFECVHSLDPSYFHGYFTSIERIHNIGTQQSTRGVWWPRTAIVKFTKNVNNLKSKSLLKLD